MKYLFAVKEEMDLKGRSECFGIDVLGVSWKGSLRLVENNVLLVLEGGRTAGTFKMEPKRSNCGG